MSPAYPISFCVKNCLGHVETSVHAFALADIKLTEKAREDWNRLAGEYQAFREEQGTYNELVEVPAVLELIGDVKGKRVLDAGCGYGYYSLLPARSGAMVTGIDISEKMIELAKNNAREASVECQFFVCDLQNLSMLAGNTFDVWFQASLSVMWTLLRRLFPRSSESLSTRAFSLSARTILC